MSDEKNNKNVPDSDSVSPEPGSSPSSHDAEQAAEAASQAASEAAKATEQDPIASPSDEAALESVAEDAKQTRAQVDAATGTSDPSAGSEGASSFELESFDGSASGDSTSELNLLNDVNLDVKIELGRTRMFVEDVLKLSSGAVVELDKLAGDPVDIYVNNRQVARGEVLVLNDNFCIRISEILDPTTDDSK